MFPLLITVLHRDDAGGEGGTRTPIKDCEYKGNSSDLMLLGS